ncbi:MAG: hypothetical protein H7A32_03005 [Deltaproteobacteria bacterium]|nr:hypothetical protein [Deltaproteobacteria bacterium]
MKLLRIISFLVILGAVSCNFCFELSAQTRQETDVQRRERVHQLILMRFVKGMNLTREESAILDNILRTRQQKKQDRKKTVLFAEGEVQKATELGDKVKLAKDLQKLHDAKKKLSQVDEEMFAEVKSNFDEIKVGQFVIIMGEIKNDVRSVQRPDPPPSPYFRPEYNSDYSPYPPQHIWVP